MASPSRESPGHREFDNNLFIDSILCEVSTELEARTQSDSTCAEPAGGEETRPLMADIMCGPNAPLSKAFLMAQWRTIPVDRIFGEHHDLSDEKVQLRLHNLLPEAAFIWAALDCSTKTRCRNIPSRIPGRNLPPPL